MPQVHRIHHSVNAEHHNRNFADVLPIFDIVFGTYHRPIGEERPAAGLGPESVAPRSLLSAQHGTIVAFGRALRPTKAEGSTF
jgi:sterol desaturase/sphingolipid hydroxylase (fatty acid hydroxylase superfamily)